jgi:hypothetical protein
MKFLLLIFISSMAYGQQRQSEKIAAKIPDIASSDGLAPASGRVGSIESASEGPLNSSSSGTWYDCAVPDFVLPAGNWLASFKITLKPLGSSSVLHSMQTSINGVVSAAVYGWEFDNSSANSIPYGPTIQIRTPYMYYSKSQPTATDQRVRVVWINSGWQITCSWDTIRVP